MNRDKILNKAIELTCGNREKDYGAPVDNMADIATMWDAWLTLDRPARDFDECPGNILAHDVALMMALMKMCRMVNSPEKEDHYVDAAAYIAIAGECALTLGDRHG